MEMPKHTEVSSGGELQINGKPPSPVIIAGMHNSGTSILARVLRQNGLFLQPNSTHDESHFFVFVNDELIMKGRGNWASYPIMTLEDVLSHEHTVGKFILKNWLADYVQWGYDGASPWGFKDPRVCVLLPLYLRLFPNAKVVHIVRDADAIARSLSKKSKHGVGILNDREHWKKLATAHVERVREFSSKDNYMEMSYEEFCRSPSIETRKVLEFLSLPVSEGFESSLESVHQRRIGLYGRVSEAVRWVRSIRGPQ